MNNEDVLEEVKRSLGIEDSEWDTRIQDFIKRLSQQLKVRLGFTDAVPEQLEYIVVEATIMRFNRIGDEGMQSYSQEGESISYGAILDEYTEDINAWKDQQRKKENKRFGGSGKAFLY